SCGSAIDADGDTHSCFLTFSTALFFMATPWSWWTVFGDLIIRPPWSRRYFTISTGGGASPASLQEVRRRQTSRTASLQEVRRRQTSRTASLQEVRRRQTSRRGALHEVRRRQTSRTAA